MNAPGTRARGVARSTISLAVVGGTATAVLAAALFNAGYPATVAQASRRGWGVEQL